MSRGDDVIAWIEANEDGLDIPLQPWQKRMVHAIFDEPEPMPEPPKDRLIGRRMRYTQPLMGLRSRYVTVLEVNAREAFVESEFGNLWVRRDSLAEIR